VFVDEHVRPVSLTSQVCKILESIVKDNMLDHIRRFGLITEMVLLKIGHAKQTY